MQMQDVAEKEKKTIDERPIALNVWGGISTHLFCMHKTFPFFNSSANATVGTVVERGRVSCKQIGSGWIR